jgi:hypothetical protein
MPLPEYLNRTEGRAARRISFEKIIRPQIAALNESLQKEMKTDEPLIQPGGFLNYQAARSAGIDGRALERRVKEGLLRIEGIEDVYFRGELEAKAPERPYLGQYRRSYHAARVGDFQVRFRERCLMHSDEGGTDHGTPYSYDTHIPIVFWGMKLKPGKIARPAYTVDIAPTLARMIGVRAPKSVDGRPLREVIP